MAHAEFRISRQFRAPNKFTCPNCGIDFPMDTLVRHVNGQLWDDECARDADTWQQFVLPGMEEPDGV